MDQSRRLIEASLLNPHQVVIQLGVFRRIPRGLPPDLPNNFTKTPIIELAWGMIRGLLHDARLSIEDEFYFNVEFFIEYPQLADLRRAIRNVVEALGLLQEYRYVYYHSVRLFCSLPLRHSLVPGEVPSQGNGTPPLGSNQSTAAYRHWPTKPVFHTMELDWPRHIFERANIAIMEGLQEAALTNDEFVSLWKDFVDSIPNKAGFTERQLRSDENFAVYDFLGCILGPFHNLTNLLGVDVKHDTSFRVPSLDEGDIRGRFRPDFSICYNGCLTLPVEIKKMPLKAYMNGDGTLDLNNEDLLDIIEQEYRYMEMSGCEYGMITDFDIVIVMKIDFNTQKWSNYINSDEGKRDQRQFEKFKQKLLKSNRSYTSCRIGRNGKFWEEMEEMYGNIKARVPISISVSKIGDTGFRSFMGRFFALALREAFYDLTGDEQDKLEWSSSEDEKKELRKRLQRRTKRPSILTEKTSFETVVEVTRASGVTHHVDNIDRAIQISEGVYQKLDGFKVLQDARYQRQVYLFTFAAYAKMFPDAREKMKWLKDDDKVVLKVFNTSDADYYMRNLKKEKEIDPDTTIHEFIASIADTYFKELESYKSISNYNEIHPDNQIHVPKLYDFGYVSMCKEDKDMIDGYDFLFGGLFILTPYVENQPHTVTHDSINRCCEEMRIMSEELHIQHNDVAKRNLIVNQGNLYLIDFSHAKLFRSSFSLEEDQTKLRKIGLELLKERENYSNLTPPLSSGSN